MNRRQADAVVGILVAAVVLGGGVLAWQALQQRTTAGGMMGGGSMMGGQTGPGHGTDPFWYVLGTLLTAAVVGGVYLAVRDNVTETGARGEPGEGAREAESEPEHSRAVEDTAETEPAPRSDAGAAEQPRQRVLDLLPEDERRVLEPVLDSPGITQIELRDRADFSKSKVSQTVSDLEKRGLLYRERQGRTYRVYPSDDLHPEQV
ncbi:MULTISPECIES: helix-turn-helix transcriptional regulator [Salinibaculum]|uniref:helix-turn-helix transcriptional regulator n=1 Tax=Salinibaculum TaxID=2732368 RepID=UPI0030CD960A